MFLCDLLTPTPAIVLNQQLDINAPSESAKFLHHVSLLTSRSDSQRRDALAYLTTYVVSTAEGAVLPTTSSSLLTAVCPLILDGSNGVRTQLLKLFQVLSGEDVKDHVTKILPYMRAGMTHLSRDIRLSAVEFLSYLIKVAGDELVSGPGGWYQTLECFTTVLGWRSTDSSKWSANKASFGGDVKSTTRIMVVLAEFLRTGLAPEKEPNSTSNILPVDFPLWQLRAMAIPTKSNAYSYLNLFGPQPEADTQMLEDREDRMEVFSKHFEAVITAGIDAAKKEGGELGRASGLLVKALNLSHIG